MQFKFVQYHDHGRYSGGNLHGDDECQLRICLTHHGRHAGGAITHGELIVYGDRFRTATAVLSANDKAKVTDRLQRETVTSGSDGVARRRIHEGWSASRRASTYVDAVKSITKHACLSM